MRAGRAGTERVLPNESTHKDFVSYLNQITLKHIKYTHMSIIVFKCL